MGVLDIVKAGVVSGDELNKVYDYAKAQGFAIPAVNVVGSNSINAVLECAKKVNSPVIIQFSNGGAKFMAGKNCPNGDVLGAISGAKHIHLLAQSYGVPVIIHTDHAARKLLPWIDGLINASIEHKKAFGVALFSSHMLDLSEESLESNLSTCESYLKRLSELGICLESSLAARAAKRMAWIIQALTMLNFTHSPLMSHLPLKDLAKSAINSASLQVLAMCTAFISPAM